MLPERQSPRFEVAVISLEHRVDRRTAFMQRWQGQPPRFCRAVDGRALVSRHDVPFEYQASLGGASSRLSPLLADWRRAMCVDDASWGAQQPRKLAAVAACHCSHLLLWEELVQSGDDDTVLIVMEDDAKTRLPAEAPLASWFAQHVQPQLPADWAFCYLNEPLKLIEERDVLNRPGGDGELPAAPHGWRALRAGNDATSTTDGPFR